MRLYRGICDNEKGREKEEEEKRKIKIKTKAKDRQIVNVILLHCVAKKKKKNFFRNVSYQIYRRVDYKKKISSSNVNA